MKNLFILIALSTASTGALAASAFSDAEDAVSYRQHSFQLIRHNFADLGDMVKGQVPFDAERAKRRAAALVSLTTLPWEAFEVPGADKAESSAKADIWQNLQDFKQKAEKFQADAAALNTAASSGSLDQIKPAVMAFAKNCKACHDKYKAD
ncbi:c-type cytochrome [Rheinheimera sp.]|uniref:c-type cytochrome n=1 Tax=Rheinheimera sp. TaxID=1869214 RepID=UPI003AF42184